MNNTSGLYISQLLGNNLFNKQETDTTLLKQGIWGYFLLVIFEGCLRKWFLPGLATPLLVIRDPIALWLIISSWKRGFLPSTFYLWGMVFIGIVSIYTALFIGHGNFFVALYGARIFLLHFPLIFVIGRIFNRNDVLKIGKATLYIALPMALLIYLQFKSPQSAWVNRGVGGDIAGAGFAGSGDFLRPPGTFSFTNGTSLFFGWVAPFVLYFWLNLKGINKWLLIAASIALITAIPISISRTLFFEVALTIIFTLIATLRKPEYLGKIIITVIIGLVALIILSQTSFFKTAIGAFTDRFYTANEQEGGLVKGVIGDRIFGGLISALESSGEQPFFGQGVGMGSNVGSKLLTDKTTFLISETPWGQIVGELGPLMGLIVISLRVGLAFKISLLSYKKLAIGDVLPWLLLSFGFIAIVQGGWSQPTSLGFCIMIGGLLLASLKSEDNAKRMQNN